jgi:hypothetical protein
MTDEKKAGRWPTPEETNPKYNQAGKKWIPLHGRYIGRLGN